MMLILVLLQLAPACAEPAPLREGQVAQCDGWIIGASHIAKLDAAEKECTTARRMDAERIIVLTKAAAQARDIMQTGIDAVVDVYERAADRDVVRLAKAPLPKPISYWDRPGWGTVWGGVLLGGLTGVFGVWAVTR